MDLATIIDDFSFLDDWEDRYRYVIDLGRDLPAFPESARTGQNKVRGCVSQVWLETKRAGGDDGAMTLTFRGDSDAMIVRGLIGVLIAMYSGKSAQEIRAVKAEDVFARLGLKDHLTPQRSNGLASMVARIRADAEAADAAVVG